MTVTVTKSEDAVVLKMNYDPKKACPPICQLFGFLCYSPEICSLSKTMQRRQGQPLTDVGTMQILTGLCYVGTGVIREAHGEIPVRKYWFGICFILIGVMCILSEKFPSPCVVALNLLKNLAGVGLAIAAIVRCSISLEHPKRGYWSPCNYRNYLGPSVSTPTNDDWEKCLAIENLLIILWGGLDILMLILAVLQVGLSIAASVLSFKALRKQRKESI